MEDLISADAARELSQKQNQSHSLNYTLTLKRLMKIIRTAAQNGRTELVFQTPRFVLDGTLADPIVLARALAKRLKQLGYKVSRRGEQLTIDWA